MKKILTLIIAVLFSISLNAQTPLTEAKDFTATDHDGNVINLFEILDRGQYVLIDFFFSSCSGCPKVATNMVDAYYQLGCNEEDVFFMEISSSDHTISAQSWIDQYSIPYPTIHNITPSTGEISGPGNDINKLYEIPSWPTTVLIAPDRSIVYSDIYPVNSPSDIINPLVEAGIKEYSCGDQQAIVLIDVEKEKSTKIEVEFSPNAAVASYYYMISTSTVLTAEEVKAQGTQETEALSYEFTGLDNSKSYYIYALPVDASGNNGELAIAEATTLCDGGEGMAQITITLEFIQETNMLRAIAQPNIETSEYHYGFSTVTLYEQNEIGVVENIKLDGYPFCEIDAWDVPVFAFGEEDYYVVAIGMNGEAEWGDVCLTRFNIATVLGVSENTMNNVSIYPNPATSNIHVSGINGEAQVSIIDMTGRMVKNVNVAEMDNATINVEDVADGIYFVKVQQEGNCKVDKVIIK